MALEGPCLATHFTAVDHGCPYIDLGGWSGNPLHETGWRVDQGYVDLVIR
jgi:hypothetical protein